jgi:hypothetical protein
MSSFAASAFAIAAFSTAAFDFDTAPVPPEPTPTYSRGVSLYPADEPFFDYNRQRRENDSLLLLLL